MRATKKFNKELKEITKKYSSEFHFEMIYMDPGFVSYKFNMKNVDNYLKDIIILAKPTAKIEKSLKDKYKNIYNLNENETRCLHTLLSISCISWEYRLNKEISSIFIKKDIYYDYLSIKQNELILYSQIWDNIARKMDLDCIQTTELIGLFSQGPVTNDQEKIRLEILEKIFHNEFEEMLNCQMLKCLENRLKIEIENIWLKMKNRIKNIF